MTLRLQKSPLSAEMDAKEEESDQEMATNSKTLASPVKQGINGRGGGRGDLKENEQEEAKDEQPLEAKEDEQGFTSKHNYNRVLS